MARQEATHGTVPDRYHAVALTTPKQVRHTLCYVLNN